MDKELQAFMNELSAKGTGPDGGHGQVIQCVFRFNFCRETARNLLWIADEKNAQNAEKQTFDLLGLDIMLCVSKNTLRISKQLTRAKKHSKSFETLSYFDVRLI